jgi:acyl dehydratase
MTEKLYFEDMTSGRRFVSEETEVTADEIKEYARRYDPQPFHMDEAAAADSLFKGLAASGWHTAGITMRLVVQSVPVAGGVIGAGMDEVSWPRPTRPGDVLHTETEILSARGSGTRPGQGWVKMRTTTLNQHGQPVQIIVPNIVVPRRPT